MVKPDETIHRDAPLADRTASGVTAPGSCVDGRPGDEGFDRCIAELGFHAKWVRLLGTYRQARARG